MSVATVFPPNMLGLQCDGRGNGLMNRTGSWGNACYSSKEWKSSSCQAHYILYEVCLDRHLTNLEVL